MHFSLFIYSLTALSLGALAAPTQDPKTEGLIKEQNTTCVKGAGNTGNDKATEDACESAMKECGAGLKYIGFANDGYNQRTCSYSPKACPNAQVHIENICRKNYNLRGLTVHTIGPFRE